MLCTISHNSYWPVGTAAAASWCMTDCGGVAAALEAAGVAVVPVLSPSECATLRAAFLRSLAAPGVREPSAEGGMVSLYFLPEKEVLISGNPNVHAALAAAYGTPRLQIQMHERMNLKRPGSQQQPLHIDVDIFHPDAKPRSRIQAMVCFDIDESRELSRSGTLAVRRRFNRYFKLAQAAFHPETGAEGLRMPNSFMPDLGGDPEAPVQLKENAGRLGSLPHRFLPLQLEMLRLSAFSAYIRMAEDYSRGEGFETRGRGVDSVSWDAMADHIRSLGRELVQNLLPEGTVLGELDLAMEAVPLKAGEMVLWDTSVPHHNLPTADTSTIPRMCSYLDIAPADAGFYAPAAQQTTNQLTRLQTTTVGSSAAPANPDELAIVRHSWEQQEMQYKLRFTTDGVYCNIRAPPLLKALYGFDPNTGFLYSWDDYENEVHLKLSMSRL